MTRCEFESDFPQGFLRCLTKYSVTHYIISNFLIWDLGARSLIHVLSVVEGLRIVHMVIPT